jgi:hypothetical protein
LQRAIEEIGDRLAAGQRDGSVRTDIDAHSVANGAAAICLALLMSMTQGSGQSSDDVILGVLDVFNATVTPPA